MSNLAQYSPFNRSYQFIHLQNSAYHFKNKLNVKPLVKTNLKRNSRSFSRSKNKTSQTPKTHYASQINFSKDGKTHTSRQFIGQYEEPKRIIHRNQIRERAKSALKRLMDTECMVTDKTRAETFYHKHQTYRNLRRRYQQNGERHMIGLGNVQLLNPTLVSFKTSHQHSHHSRIAISNQDDIL